jgi:hypothetical protein
MISASGFTVNPLGFSAEHATLFPAQVYIHDNLSPHDENEFSSRFFASAGKNSTLCGFG